ncbi:MAG: hypothetical protein ACE5FH_06365 [Candidatus Zixiibacteriota bacterium]
MSLTSIENEVLHPGDVRRFVLDDGTIARVVSQEVRGDVISIAMEWDLGHGNRVIRQVTISTSLMSVRVLDHENRFRFAYSMDYSADARRLIYTAWTSSDSLSVDYREGGLAASYNLNGHAVDMHFASMDDVSRAQSLYESTATTETGTLSTEDLILYSQYEAVDDLLRSQPALAQDCDTRITSQLMTNEEFVGFVVSLIDAQALSNLACDIAGIASLSCFFPAAVLLCVPALGITTACGIAGIMTAILYD